MLRIIYRINLEGYYMILKYAKRIAYLKASEIREILKVTERPEIISFAGGLPAPELFPVKGNAPD